MCQPDYYDSNNYRACQRMLKQIYSFRLYNDAEVGRVIGDVNATDADRGQFGLIEYAISNNVDRYFDIDPVTVRAFFFVLT